MKLRDYGELQPREWFQQLLQWSRKKITFEENMDGIELLAYLNTSETEIGHALGRMPKSITPVAKFPYGVAAISFTRAPTIDKLFMKSDSGSARYQWLRIE